MQINQQRVDRIERELIKVKAQIDASRRPAVTGFDFGAPRAADGTAWTVDAENPERDALKERYRDLADALAEAAQLGPSELLERLIALAKVGWPGLRLWRMSDDGFRLYRDGLWVGTVWRSTVWGWQWARVRRPGGGYVGGRCAGLRDGLRQIRAVLAKECRVGSMVYYDGVLVSVDPHPKAYEIARSEPLARPADPPRNRFGEPRVHGAGTWGR